MKNFYLLIALTTFLLACVHFGVNHFFGLDWNNLYIILYIYFPIVTLSIYLVLSKQINKRPQLFVNYFMGSMTVKLFLSMILLFIVLYTHSEERLHFAIVFMLMYLVYTALSVVFLLQKIKRNE